MVGSLWRAPGLLDRESHRLTRRMEWRRAIRIAAANSEPYFPSAILVVGVGLIVRLCEEI